MSERFRPDSGQAIRLEDVVHDAASQQASNAVNGGVDEMIDYLLSLGWTMAEIKNAIGAT